jgi:hypothetical protein
MACSLAVITLVLAVYWLHPVAATSLPGGVGPLALSFPLHLLVLTVAALGLGLLAVWLRARLAASIFILCVILSALLALWPSIAMWQLARQEDVSLSLATYLATPPIVMLAVSGASELSSTGRRPTARTQLVLDV